jgi:dienelactone hydrolase
VNTPRSSMTRGLVLLVLVLTSACAQGPRPRASLGAQDSGTVWFMTEERDVLSGDLAFPPGSGPFPVVVLMHGCNGLPGQAVTGWHLALRSWGYATFILDSFRGRNLQNVCADALALTPNRRIPDSYGAFRILVTHPKIDPARIVLMGFSHGGTAVLAGATEWARRTYAPDRPVAFRAFLPFYPYCNAVIPEMDMGFSAPVRIHIGELDDWTPARTCESLVADARAAGADIRINVYKNAQHAFDSVGLPTGRLPDVQNAADCTPRLAGMEGPILNLFELRKCIRKGATVGWNPAATEEARRNVRAQLAEIMK